MENRPERAVRLIGWREWVSLPELGVLAIKAKVDTGAKTSSLHAYDIEVRQEGEEAYVHFKMHPLQHDFSVVLACRALLVDQRTITNSGGQKEERYVIRTTMVLNGLRKKVDLTLTNRETMNFRMLIGRRALRHYHIDPRTSYLAGKTLMQRRFLRKLLHLK